MNNLSMNQPLFSPPISSARQQLPKGYSKPSSYHHHYPHPQNQGFCPSCCHPIWACCCGYKECRKESKELLVIPQEEKDLKKSSRMMSFLNFFGPSESGEKKSSGDNVHAKMAGTESFIRSKEKFELLTRQAAMGTGTAFIGGGCCVHLSVEFMPTVGIAETPGLILIMVVDSENTILSWGKLIDGDDGYCIKEDIITTNPGATLTVIVLNITARVRWCEVFSC